MSALKFVDLFAGCGGFSLGLSQAGLRGAFAIERDSMAFETFKANFIGRGANSIEFQWPEWLPQHAWDIEDLLRIHGDKLRSLAGEIDVLAGGPPCQGFSFAGRRQEDDPRNFLSNRYVEVVEALQPRALILENVPGMRSLHKKKNTAESDASLVRRSYYAILVERLEAAGYVVSADLVDASRFGVPQKRSRLIAIGLRKDLATGLTDFTGKWEEILEASRLEMLAQLGVPETVTASMALSDLETGLDGRLECVDPESRGGFVEAAYSGPSTVYQQIMHDGHAGPMDSMRLARHRPEIEARFAKILSECRRGVPLSEAARNAFGLRKQRIHPMSATEPSPTVTTLPDDILHYSEPRILTVRESARLQSFPDWFQFKGKYTTGGMRRKKECPRYTQVGNAVPPLLARAIGIAITKLLDEAAPDRSSNSNKFMELDAGVLA